MWEGVHSALGVVDGALPAQLLADLDAEGYCRLDGHLDAGQVAAVLAGVRVLLAGSDRRQGGTVHLGSLLDGGAEFDPVWCNPRLLAGVVHLLGPAMRITELHYRAPLPGFGAQHLHADFAGAARPGDWQAASALVLLRDVGEADGPTRLVPRSHLDPDFTAKAADADAPHPAQRTLTGPAGTCWLWNGHLWHSGTRNRGDEPRHALLLNAWRRTPASEQRPAELSAATVDRLGEAALLLL